MRTKIFIALSYFIFFTLVCNAQLLKPGFDKEEYIEMLKVSAAFGDSTYVANFPKPIAFKKVYRSPVMGILNMWDLWTNDKGVAVVSIRGTTADMVSWMANFYAAMVPAKGSLKLSDSLTFDYDLSDNPKAGVHIGWLIATGFLSHDILPKIDSLYKAGTKDIILMGHSQGGAINFLLTAYLYSLQKQGRLPKDIRFKTYCSAGPKPGNLYFAYDYEAMTQNGWAYNVVNTADWVPETPFSVQTVNDFNNTNPFKNAKKAIKKMKFPQNLVLRHLYNRLDKPTWRSQRRFERILGKTLSKMLKKTLPGYVPPKEYFHSNDYVRTGTTIVLPVTEEYRKKYPESETNVFIHHFHPPYLYLIEQLDLSPNKPN